MAEDNELLPVIVNPFAQIERFHDDIDVDEEDGVDDDDDEAESDSDPSEEVQRAWRRFLERGGVDLSLDRITLRRACVDYLFDNLFGSSSSNPKTTTTNGNSRLYRTNMMGNNGERNKPSKLSLANCTIPEADGALARMVELIQTLKADLKGFSIMDDRRNPYLTFSVLLELLRALEHVEGLEAFVLYGIDLRSKGLHPLITQILESSQHHLVDVTISGCRVSDEGIASVAAGLRKNTQLHSFTMYECRLNDSMLQTVVHGMLHSSNQHLKEIKFWENDLTSASLTAVAKLLDLVPSLESLELVCRQDSPCADQHLEIFAEALRSHPSLRKLELSCTMSAEQTLSLLHSYDVNPTIREFELGILSMDRAETSGATVEMRYGLFGGRNFEDLEKLLLGLHSMNSMNHLRLLKTDFVEEHIGRCVKDLFESSKEKLTSLEFQSCCFDTESFREITRGLRSMSLLQHLSMDRCQIDDVMLELLVDAVTDAEKLEHVNLTRNGITPASIVTLNTLVQQHPRLQSVNVSHNRHLFENNTHIPGLVLDSLRSHPSLKELYLSSSSLDIRHFASLLHIFNDNTVFKKVQAGFATVVRNDKGLLEVFFIMRNSDRIDVLLEGLEGLRFVESVTIRETDVRGPVAGQSLRQALGVEGSVVKQVNIHGVDNITLLDLSMVQGMSLGLSQSPVLQSVCLTGCGLDDNMLHAIVDGILQSTTIRTACLRYNRLTSASLQSLERLLHHPYLDTLDVSRNKALFRSPSPQAIRSFVDALGVSPVRCLSFSHCSMDNDALKSVFGVLETNTTIEELGFGDLDSCVFDWVASIPRLLGIRTLIFPRKLRPDDDWQVLLAALRRNPYITRLRYERNPALFPHAMNRRDIQQRSVQQILNRNQLVEHVQDLIRDLGTPLPLWPTILEKLGSNSEEGTPVFAFLRARAVDLEVLTARKFAKRKA